MSRSLLQLFLIANLSSLSVCHNFVHPGVLNSISQLNNVKFKVKAKLEPWNSSFVEMKKSRYALLSHKPKPRKVIECGLYSNPNHGCCDETIDSLAAYTHALLWFITSDKRHARKSIQIMNAWSAVIANHNNTNAALQTGMSGAVWARAAEIIRHTFPVWYNWQRFKNMLKEVYLPVVSKGMPNHNGNWELIMIEAMGAISVVIDDRQSFDNAIEMWRKRLPAYVYLKSDGNLPIKPPEGNKDTSQKLIEYWYNQRKFVDGISQETCRDFGHYSWGMAAAINMAEIAYHQHIDLYSEGLNRIVKSMEFHANYILGNPVPKWLCSGSIITSTMPTWEIGFNHYHNRLNVHMPKSKQMITKLIRPTGASYFLAWETLTHAENP